jgi:prevent-host-death family protein
MQPPTNPEVIDSTRFQRTIGEWLDACRYDDKTLMVTKHNRPFAVLMSIREYNRLRRLEERSPTEERGGEDA